MESQTRDFAQVRPALHPYVAYPGEHSVVMELEQGHNQLVLPKEYWPIVELMNGENSIKDIIAEVFERDGKVSFNSIAKAISLLRDHDFLQAGGDAFGDAATAKGVHEQKSNAFFWSFFQLSLVGRMSWRPLSIVYWTMASLILGCFALPFAVPGSATWWRPEFSDFLRFNGHYDRGFLVLYGCVSALITLKTLIKILLMFAATGKVYGIRVHLGPLFSALMVSETSIYGQSNRAILYSYSFLTPLLYFTLISFLSFAFPGHYLIRDLTLVAWLLTLVELDPYRQSEMTKLFALFYAQDQLSSVLPYLKNCSLNGLADNSRPLKEELRYLVYSIMAMLWAVGFGLFATDLLATNVNSLLFEFQLGGTHGRVSAGLILLVLTVVFWHLAIDLFQTLFKNVLGPLKQIGKRRPSKAKKLRPQDFSIDDLVARLRQNMLFSGLGDSVLQHILSKAEICQLEKGDYLIRQGQEGREVLYLLEGMVEVNIDQKTGEKKKVIDLAPGAVIGERAILEHIKRTANVEASERVVFLKLDGVMFEGLIQDQSHQVEMERVKLKIEMNKFVSSAGLFKDFPPEIMNVFIDAGDLINFPAHKEVVTQGEFDKTFYLIIKGQVEVVREGEVLAELTQGDFFGEMALLSNASRSATVRTTEESLLLFIEDDAFWRILSHHVELGMYLESVSSMRAMEQESA